MLILSDSYVRCAECGTTNEATQTSCTNCPTDFTHKERKTTGCYYCGRSMNIMWAADKKITIVHTAYMLCDDCADEAGSTEPVGKMEDK